MEITRDVATLIHLTIIAGTRVGEVAYSIDFIVGEVREPQKPSILTCASVITRGHPYSASGFGAFRDVEINRICAAVPEILEPGKLRNS
jgi:hypothetical protein